METHKEHLFKKVGIPSNVPMSKKQLSVLFKVPIKALDEIYDRGIGAWKTNISSVRLQKDLVRTRILRNTQEARDYQRSNGLWREYISF